MISCHTYIKPMSIWTWCAVRPSAWCTMTITGPTLWDRNHFHSHLWAVYSPQLTCLRGWWRTRRSTRRAGWPQDSIPGHPPGDIWPANASLETFLLPAGGARSTKWGALCSAWRPPEESTRQLMHKHAGTYSQSHTFSSVAIWSVAQDETG